MKPKQPLSCYLANLELEEVPNWDDIQFAGQGVVSEHGRGTRRPGRRQPLARVADTSFFLSRMKAPKNSTTPVLATPFATHVGIDDTIYSQIPFKPRSTLDAASEKRQATYWQAPIHRHASPARVPAKAIRVAVIDFDFVGMPRLTTARTKGAALLLNIRPVEALRAPTVPPKQAMPTPTSSHGAMAVAAVANALLSPPAGTGLLPTVVIQPYQLPSAGGQGEGGSPFLGPYYLFLALLHATAQFRADVVVAAIGSPVWGVPAYLRELLRMLPTPCPDRPRGTLLVVPVGAPSREVDDTGGTAIPADDLSSQFGVTAVAPVDRKGFWRRSGTTEGNGAFIGRLGANTELAGPGYIEASRSFGLTGDDSSRAAAHVAGAATALLRHNPLLLVDEARGILRLTSTVPTQAEGPPLSKAIAKRNKERYLEDQEARGAFTFLDRSGHNFKLGYGLVNSAAAVLAACDPFAYCLYWTRQLSDRASMAETDALTLKLAQHWSTLIGALSPAQPRAKAFRPDRGWVLVRLAIHSFSFRENLLWILRHCRNLDRNWARGKHNHLALVDRFKLALRMLMDSSSMASEVPQNVLDLLRSAGTARWAQQVEARPDFADIVVAAVRAQIRLHA